MRSALAVLVAAIALSGCGGWEQKVFPVSKLESKQICVIENPKVQSDFLEIYKTALEGKGYQVQVLPESARPSSCPITSRYTANWGWDVIFYLSYAEIIVYNDSKRAGRALYRGKQMMRTETKIKELVDRLFPGG